MNRFGGKKKFSFGHAELGLPVDNQVKITSWHLAIVLSPALLSGSVASTPGAPHLFPALALGQPFIRGALVSFSGEWSLENKSEC